MFSSWVLALRYTSFGLVSKSIANIGHLLILVLFVIDANVKREVLLVGADLALANGFDGVTNFI